MIEVKDLTKKYGNFVAVNDISFQIDDNEVVGFLGPNGAGKSTTMNMITGYIEPTNGKVIINGNDMEEKPRLAKRQIGYMPENVPLYKDLTVKEFIKYMAELKGLKGKEKKYEIERVIDETGLDSVSNKLIKYISKGYRQRVGLAGALVGNPDVLILDEPTVGLDPKQIKEIRGLIKSLGRRHTVILSSHILSEVSQICERVIIINHGEIVTVDTPENLENKMRNNNIIVVTVKDEDDNMMTIKSDLNGVSKVRMTKDNKDGSKEYEIIAKEGVDLRKQIFDVFPKKNIEIIELKKTDVSLEDAFLKLINDKEDVLRAEYKSKIKEDRKRKAELKEMPFKERQKEKSKDRKAERKARKAEFEERYEKERAKERKEKLEAKDLKEKKKQAKKARKVQAKEMKQALKEDKKLKGDVIKITATGKTKVKKSKETKAQDKIKRQERIEKEKSKKEENKKNSKGGKK